jgi:redox-sensitive bicupin YhaK (pirin superfamily)
MTSRTIRTQFAAEREDIGDLVTRRPMHPLEELNPFLFINHHGPQLYPPRNGGLPFGPHPHRGFETVTFIVDGALLHRDTKGHESTIRGGGIQWMTAGKGVVHSETSPREFLERGGAIEILQLWLNLPAALKTTEPRYIGLQRDEIPSFTSDQGRARIDLISGSWDGHPGPVESLTGVQLMTVELDAGAKVAMTAPRGRTVFLYVVRGQVSIAGQRATAFRLLEMEDGDQIEAEAVDDSLLIFGHAEPLREPIAAYGPFVMNSRREIEQAFEDYQSGRFGTMIRGA